MYGANSINIQAQFMSQQQQVPKIDANIDDAKLREQTDAFESVILKMLMDNSEEHKAQKIIRNRKCPADRHIKRSQTFNAKA